jgi:hypothetical protein
MDGKLSQSHRLAFLNLGPVGVSAFAPLSFAPLETRGQITGKRSGYGEWAWRRPITLPLLFSLKVELVKIAPGTHPLSPLTIQLL